MKPLQEEKKDEMSPPLLSLFRENEVFGREVQYRLLLDAFDRQIHGEERGGSLLFEFKSVYNVFEVFEYPMDFIEFLSNFYEI